MKTERLPADAGRFDVICEILKYRVLGDVAGGGGEITTCPEMAAPVALANAREFLLDLAR